MNVCVAKVLATNTCWRNRQVKNAETENPRLVSVGIKIYKPQIFKKIVWRNQDPKLNLRNLHMKYLHLMLGLLNVLNILVSGLAKSIGKALTSEPESTKKEYFVKGS